MAALILAAPEALRHEKEKTSAAAKFPEFRAWHELLQPLFGITAPDWTEKVPSQLELAGLQEEVEDDAEEEGED